MGCGCCTCYSKIETEKQKEKKKEALSIQLNNGSGSNPTSIIQKLEEQRHHPDTTGCVITDEKTLKDYKLNDLRSLEGVAQLWSKKMESENKLSFLQHSQSTPVEGNMYNAITALSPISISTYFFQHTPANQLNLLRSHSDKIGSSHSMAAERKTNATDSHYQQLSAPVTPETSNPHNYGFNLNLNLNNAIQSSVSAADLKSSYRMSNLSPLVSDGDEDKFTFNEDTQEMEIEIEIDFANEEDDIFSVTQAMEAQFNLSSDDYIEQPSGHGKFANIGVGASGIVTKAFHFASCKMLAIKHCRSSKKQQILAFEKEAHLYEEFLENKYIIDIIGIGKGHKNNELLMGLEFMDLNSCQSLQIHTNVKNMQRRELIIGYIAWNVLKALQCLHAQLYVHNDVKPGNILVNKYGEIKLSDFDTVLQMESNTTLLTKNNGTQKFQSPEKLLFSPNYGTNTDIWSLAISMCVMMFGERKSDTTHDKLSYTTNPPRFDTNTHELSVHCCDFMNRCLRVNRQDRPEATELLKHAWFEEHINIESVRLKDKWPWLITVEPLKQNNEFRNLLFMINALIIHYSTRKFTQSSGMAFSQIYHDTEEHKFLQRKYTDEERIANMAKYAYCTKDNVLDRIRVTVAYIKSQLNKMDIQ